MAHDDARCGICKLITFWNIPCEAKRKELTEKLGLTQCLLQDPFCLRHQQVFDALLIALDVGTSGLVTCLR